MNKAFIFDMDGVLIDSENAWRKYGNSFLVRLFGKEIAQKVGDTIGMTVNDEYKIAVSFGFKMDKDKFLQIYDNEAARIYEKAQITKDIEKLAFRLMDLDFRLGLVSGSRKNWIEHVLPRLSFREKLEVIISVNDTPHLKPKPNPDAYLEAIKKLNATPQTSIVLEDSNSGIQAAKATGAYTIGFKKNLVPKYEQKGADIYAGTVNDVIKIVELHRLKIQ